MMVRSAQWSDVDQCARLLDRQREAYQGYAPTFWKLADDHSVKTRRYLRLKTMDPRSCMLVCKSEIAIEGFLIANRAPVPPVYNPGGTTMLVDDFVVRDEDSWSAIGRHLLEHLAVRAKDKGWTQLVVVNAIRDTPKQAFLERSGLCPSSLWSVANFDALTFGVPSEVSC